MPDADSLTSTLLGVGDAPANQFICEMTGSDGASLGKMVRKLATVPWVTVTFNETARAVVGISQFPLAPHTLMTYVSAGPSGVARGPTLSEVFRMSIKRQGTIGTNPSCPVAPAPEAICTPPPKVPATSAAIAAKGIVRFIRLVSYSSTRLHRSQEGRKRPGLMEARR